MPVRFQFDANEPYAAGVWGSRDLMTDMPYPIYPEGLYLAVMVRRGGEEGVRIVVY